MIVVVSIGHVCLSVCLWKPEMDVWRRSICPIAYAILALPPFPTVALRGNFASGWTPLWTLRVREARIMDWEAGRGVNRIALSSGSAEFLWHYGSYRSLAESSWTVRRIQYNIRGFLCLDRSLVVEAQCFQVVRPSGVSLGEFHQIYHFDSFGDEAELVRFWDHGQEAEAKSTRRSLPTVEFCICSLQSVVYDTAVDH